MSSKVWDDEVRRRVHDRHYNLRQAKINLKLRDLTGFNQFMRLAETDQVYIDLWERSHPGTALDKICRGKR